MASSESYFPRGPLSKTTTSTTFKTKASRKGRDKPLGLFKKKPPRIKKHREPINQRYEKKELGKSIPRLNDISLLRYETLQEGLLVAGCIKEIFATQLTVTLPGRIVAQVKINKISNPYRSLLLSSTDGGCDLPEGVSRLKDLFEVGEMVTCYVEQVFETGGHKHKVLVSLNPSDINRDKTERILEENVTLVGAIKSKEDHGYAVDLGIQGVTAFLPLKRTNRKSEKDETLPVGKIVRAAVKKVLRANVGVTTVELTLEQDILSKAVPRSGFTVDNLTPGQRMNVFVKQVMPNGIEVSPVHAFEDYSSYVHIAYVSDIWGNTSGLDPGKVFTATFLYSVTPVNILYFSMKMYSTGPNSLPCFKDGAIVNDAKVVAIQKNSIFLQLGSRNLNAKGFVSARQFGDITNFVIGQTYKTRILHYDFIEKIYICSLNKDIISAEVFSTKELQLGQTVKCTVTGFQEGKGLALKVGTLHAFAPLRHLTDHPHRYLNVANLFKINSRVTAKVLNITEGNEIILTLKPTLLSSEALCRFEDAVVRNYYYGVVQKIIDDGFIVKFFGDTVGLVPNRLIAPFITGLSKESFHEGQVIRCYVVTVKPLERKLILSLTPDAGSNLKVGSSYKLEVLRSKGDCLEVIVSNTSLSGHVPLDQVTDHLSLLSCSLTNFSCGKVIEDAVLYSFTEDLTPLFTLRTSVKKFLQANSFIYSGNLSDIIFNKLVVPCSVKRIEDCGVHINIPLLGFNDSFFLSQENLSDDKLNASNFKENQALMAVIKSKDNSINLHVSSENCTGEFWTGLEILEDYLSQAALFHVVNIGEKYRVTVTNVTEDAIHVKLKKKLTGSFKKELSSKNYKKNDKFEAIALWQDPKTQHVYLYPNTELNIETSVKEIDDVFCGSVEESQVLLLLEDLIVGVILSGKCNRHLTFIPSKTHFNDFSRKKPSLLSSIRVVPYKFVNGFIISEREKRIKIASKQTNKTEKQIISELLLRNFNENNKIKKERNSTERRNTISSENELLFDSNVINNGDEDVEDKNSIVKLVKKSKKNKNFVDANTNGDVTESNFDSKRRKTISNENELLFDSEVINNGDKDVEDKNSSIKFDKKSKKNKNFVDANVNGDVVERNVGSSNISKINGSCIVEDSSELDSIKKKGKRRRSESESDREKSQNLSSNKRNFEVSPVIVENKDKKKSSPISLNGFNVTSCETPEIEESLCRKSKKRKNSVSFDESVSGNVDDCKNVSVSELLKGRKRSDSITVDKTNSKTDSHDVNEKLEKCLEKSVKKSVKDKTIDLKVDNSYSDTKTKVNEKPRLSLSGSGKFFWDVNAKDFSVSANENEFEENEEDDDDGNEKSKKPKTAAEKKAAAKEAEKHLREAEQHLLEAEVNPQSADHFERLTLAQPNNSLIWVKYMAYHLQATEIEKARAVARRALKIVSHREEQERLNVWVALLNLENLYGTQESLKNTLDEAIRSNDEYQVYSKMAEIYTDSHKNLELDRLTSVMVKKFKTDLECWLLCCRCLLKSGLTEKASTIFQRGLQTLSAKEHVPYITRFALLENTFGSSEHAQTLMEHVLTTYPGRITSWITYIDMLTKSGQIDLARNVLERAVGQKLPVKKMKTLYKKWLQFEEQHGSETLVNHVREAAENYVNSLTVIASV